MSGVPPTELDSAAVVAELRALSCRALRAGVSAPEGPRPPPAESHVALLAHHDTPPLEVPRTAADIAETSRNRPDWALRVAYYSDRFGLGANS